MYNIDIQSPEFVKCLERGEREAFQRLFEMYHKALCFFATRIVRDSLEAEDIVQDVFLAFWRMGSVNRLSYLCRSDNICFLPYSDTPR